MLASMSRPPNNSAASSPVSTAAAESYDYIIVGGGAAGCVLAARLSENPKVRVLLLEAGPAPDSLWIRMPAGMGRLFVNPRYNWCFETQSEPQLDRKLFWPQGKTLGGSSAINGMAFVRGHPEDYDGWRDAGAVGWGWRDLAPIFQRLERRGGDPGRGAAGPVRVSDPGYVHASARAFCAAARTAGLAPNPDYNGVRQEGASLLQFTIDRGVRCSAADAYLKPALRRPNLRVLTEAHARRVLFAGGRASGVEFRRGDAVQVASAGREVIVAAGAIGSPRLLLSSGVGSGPALRDLGLAVQVDLPSVGENLVDHPYVHMTFGVRPGASLNHLLRGWKVYLQGALWMLSRRGPLTIGASQAVAFVRSRPEVSRPDLQINFRPISHSFDSAGRLAPDPAPRVTAAICALRPGSRGRVWLTSPDPEAPPAMLGNYLADPADTETLVSGVAWARRIFASTPLGDLVRSEDKPGPGVTGGGVADFIRETVQTMCHPVGTCRMGAGADSVVDAQLRVRGVAGLRVVDSSIMPSIVSGNTMAATYAIAEKGADMIREAARN